MQRSTIAWVVVLLIILGGVALYAMTRPEAVPEISTTGITLPATGYAEHARYYDITASYATSTPLLKSASPLADATARSLMLGFVRDTIVQFKTDGNFDNLTQKDVEMMGFDEGRKETLTITYAAASSAHTVSYIFTIYQDTLGAHGNTFFKTFTFNSKTGATLSFSDVFSPNAPYLDNLSSLSRTKLPTVIGPDADTTFIKNGTTPDAKNFASFFFDNKDFVILFAPYAVAPYAAGPQTLRIPLSELSSILKPEYQ